MKQEDLALLEIRTTISGSAVHFDLLHGANGVHLEEYKPKKAQFKGGGVFQDSPFANGRQLVHSVFASVEESIKLKYRSGNHDEVAYQDGYLDQLLLLAAAYKPGASNVAPVYLAFQKKGTTNPQYGLIVKGSTAEVQGPISIFEEDDRDGATWDNIELSLERGDWLENPPGTSTQIATGNNQTFEGEYFGNDDGAGNLSASTGDDVYLSNIYLPYNLTHIFNYDDSAASFSSNLIGTSLPWSLFPASAAVDDCVYFGVDSSVTPSGLFWGLIFNLSTAAAATAYTIVWERYYSGSWSSLYTTGTAADFDTTGSVSCHWGSLHAEATVNSVTGYWVRARIDTLTGAFTRPVQQSQNIYTPSLPYAEIPSTEVGGIMEASASMQFRNVSGPATVVSGALTSANRIVAGLRAVDRGSNFNAYILLSDEHEYSGITVEAIDTANAGFATVPFGCGRMAYVYANASELDEFDAFKITIDRTLSPDYMGKFRFFLRTIETLPYGRVTFRVRVEIAPGVVVFTSDPVSIPAHTSGSYPDLTALGGVDLASAFDPDTDSFDLVIYITAEFAAGTAQYVYIPDIALIPADEWIMDSFDTAKNESPARQTGLKDLAYLTVGSINRVDQITTVAKDSDDVNFAVWATVANGPVTVAPGMTQRLWVVAGRYLFGLAGESYETSEFGIAHTFKAWRNQRYLGIRGNQ